MKANRLEAFSDGVFAIIVTIMVLELRPPAENSAGAMGLLTPHFAAYLLSFVIVGIHWLSHHRLIDAVGTVGPTLLWANMALLFFLSLIPFATANLNHHHWQGFSVVAYMGLIVCCSLSLLAMRMVARASLTAASGDFAELDASVRLSALITVLQAATTIVAWFAPAVAVTLMAVFALVGIAMTFRGPRLLTRRTQS